MKVAATFAAGVVVALALAGSVRAADSKEAIEYFEKKIRPVLAERCYGCHSASAKALMGGLMLDTVEGWKRGGTSGKPVIIPYDPSHSLIMSAIRGLGRLKMPPGAPLPQQQIDDFEIWINTGAADPRGEPAPPPPPPYDFDKARQFWSFQPVRDAAPPAVADAAWSRTAIDRFIKAKLDEKKLTPLGVASKRALLRRLTFDLTGLPPTPDEMAAFLADTAANAYEKQIDRLLKTQAYGERWGRHWLDLVRYADTSGCNSDYPVPDAYRYRNWVIQAFNEDKPYDQFLREQIAGDLLPARKDAQGQEIREDRNAKIVATGYLAIARRFGSRSNEFHLTIEDIIDNLGKVAMGLTVACARCHNHKFDPIPTRDYYALYGIFQSTKYAFPGTEIYQHAKDFVALSGPREAARLKDYQTETSGLDDRIEDFAAGKEGKNLSKEEKDKEVQRMKDRIAVLERRAPTTPRAYAVTEGTPRDAKIQIQGDSRKPGEVAPRGFLTVLGGQALPADEKGSGRRELADWVTGPANPLMARVMVNRIWQHHFGKGLVGTPNDFGVRGDAPTHPELLDFLAARFRESGYSVKAMHKLILMTRAYQSASGDLPRDSQADPQNKFLWRFDRRRLDAEEVRDAILAVAGDLDPTMGGPHPFPPETSFKYTQHLQFFATYDNKQRSVYLMQQRLRKHPFLETFDGADPNASTPKRIPGETSLQALAMLNSQFVDEQADLLAVRVGLAHSSDSERIAYAYRLAFGRPATQVEILEGTRYLAQARAAYAKSAIPADRQPRAALGSLMHVLLASDEFIFVD